MASDGKEKAEEKGHKRHPHIVGGDSDKHVHLVVRLIDCEWVSTGNVFERHVYISVPHY